MWADLRKTFARGMALCAGVCALFSACGSENGPASPNSSDAGASDAADLSDVMSSSTDGPSEAGAIRPWAWVPVDGATCSNGSPAGYGVQEVEGSNEVVILVQGGGACWDANTCYILKTASHIDETITEATMNAEVKVVEASGVLDRANGPFKRATTIYVPYCTGDLHIGDNVGSYDGFNPAHKLNHKGGANMAVFTADWVKKFPNAQQIWMIGISAGGYGVHLNYDRVAKAFPAAKVDLLGDSSPLTTPKNGNWATWQAAWKMTFPAGCTTCSTSFESLVDYLPSTYVSRRFGLLAFEDDTTITLFFGYALGEMKTELNKLLANQYKSPNTRYFVLPGNEHVMLPSFKTRTGAGGAKLSDFVNGWAAGTSAFANVH